MISELIRDVNNAVFGPTNLERNTCSYLVNRATDEVNALLEIQGRAQMEGGTRPLVVGSRRLRGLSSAVSNAPDHELGELLLQVAFVLGELKVDFNRRTDVPRGIPRAAESFADGHDSGEPPNVALVYP
jgi:hypothetical protein